MATTEASQLYLPDFPIVRFEDKLDIVRDGHSGYHDADGKATACWEWTESSRQRAGYGAFWYDGRTRIAHRIAWIAKHGPIPDGLVLRHRCDNPPCARIDLHDGNREPSVLGLEDGHFILGTVIENNTDRDRQNRGARQVARDNGNAILTEDMVRAIRREHAAGTRASVLAIKYAVHRATVRRIVRRETWATVED